MRIDFERARMLLFLVALAVPPGTVDGSTVEPVWITEGDQATSHFGWSVASAGDVNGDGYADVIVGAPLFDNGETSEGRAFVYLGSSSGLATTPAWIAESDHASAQFGFSVGTAGDVNGDGYSDVIVGAPFDANGETGEGRAYVYLGSPSGLAPTPAWTTESNQANAQFGRSVATAGDVNGDGYSDVIVGSPTYGNGESGEGRAFVYLGSASGLAPTPAWTAESDQANAFFGKSVASAGDVNGDGYSDVIAGAYQYSNGENIEGRAFVYLGSTSGLDTIPAWTAESDQVSALFGSAVGTAGDVNGDGYSDVIVGSPGYDNGQIDEGTAFVYLGSASGVAADPVWSAESNQLMANIGHSVSTAGDVNGDGYSDIVVGALRYDNGQVDEGRAFVYLGSATGPAATPAWIAENDQGGAQLGFSVATGGDVDRDGYEEVIVGAPFHTNGQTDEGRAYVFSGGPSAGRVPDAAPGLPLEIAKAAAPSITLTWGSSCVPTDNDYAIYEGTLGSFYSHASRFCGTGGARSFTFAPSSGSVYYLVVPLSATWEGSYGVRSDGSERPVGIPACLPQSIASCP